jgi:polyvinyl alcohol dehydrogenase (cytochrome)
MGDEPVKGALHVSVALLVLLLCIPGGSWAAEGDKATQAAGAAVFANICAVCHEHGVAGAPNKVLLKQMPAGAIDRALTRGAMAAQGARLTSEERRQVIVFLAGDAPESTHHPLLRCETPLWRDQPVPMRTTSWGMDARNSRSVPGEEARLSRADVARLKLRWSFVFPDSIKVRSQPVIVAGALFVGSQDGTVYALDADDGCVYWSFQATGEIRGPVSYGTDPSGKGATLYFGDVFANVYALDVRTGALEWTVKVDDHATARVVGAPLLASHLLFVPVGSWGEEIAAASSDYACCTFRGSMVALDPRNGAIVWKRYTVPQAASLHQERGSGKPQLGPSGASVWSSPAYDDSHDLLYFGTGDNFSYPSDDNSDAVFALRGATGEIVWKRQVQAGDAYNDACLGGKRLPNCPKRFGPDVDFTAAPVLATEHGREILLAAQKSGDTFGFDPTTGNVLWHTRLSADSNPWSGGIWYGMVWQSHRLIVPTVSFPPISSPAAAGESLDKIFLSARVNGLNALDPLTGKRLWHAPFPANCTQGTCQSIMMAPIGVPDIVFAGAVDGVIRAYDDRNGKTLWSFDTAREFVARNGDVGKGGTIAGAGAVAAARGHLYVLSTNVLLAFSPED